MNVKNVLALGAGTMGSQVSFYYAMRGFDVIQFDISEEALTACKQLHRGYVESFQSSNPTFSDGDIEAGLARISYSSDLESAAQNADLVTESVPEVLEIKQKIYADLDRFCPEHTIFTSNTSTMPPSAIAPAIARPERFLALHYAMPVWDSPIAEVMKHPGTSEETFQAVISFVEASKLAPIKLEKEQPGYITNSLLVPWLMSAFSLVANGISSYQDVDKTWMICHNSGHGPVAVMDFLGFEVFRNVLKLLIESEPGNPQHQKNLDYLEEHFLNKGLTGALAGQGFYSYPNPEFEDPDFLK